VLGQLASGQVVPDDMWDRFAGIGQLLLSRMEGEGRLPRELGQQWPQAKKALRDNADYELPVTATVH
jgi:hypothetical protein